MTRESMAWSMKMSFLCLKCFPFKLSGKAAIKLLEVSLIFGFKTEPELDKGFDRR